MQYEIGRDKQGDLILYCPRFKEAGISGTHVTLGYLEGKYSSLKVDSSMWFKSSLKQHVLPKEFFM